MVGVVVSTTILTVHVILDQIGWVSSKELGNEPGLFMHMVWNFESFIPLNPHFYPFPFVFFIS